MTDLLRRRSHRRWRVAARVLPLAFAGVLAASATSSAEVQVPGQGQVTSNTYSPRAGSSAAPANGGAPQDPLKYDCTHPTSGPSGCEHVGLTHGYWNNHVVNFLYSANYYCDHSVASTASTGCEAGKPAAHSPTDATSQDPLYIPVPLGFTPKQGLQCPKQGNCIDHGASMDLSALYPVLKPLLHLTSAAPLANAPVTPHSHVIFNRNNNLPEWWNVVVVPVTNQAGFNTVIAATSKAQLTHDLGTSGVYTSVVPTNEFLYFQVLGGTSTTTADAAMNQGRYNGADGPPAASPGTSWDPLGIHATKGQTSDCAATAASPKPPACSDEGIGLTKGSLKGKVVNFLYTENYFCDRSVSSRAPTGCEAGASYAKLPPGTSSTSEIDPLYIITPLFAPTPTNLQCATPGYCIDHPQKVDLSRLSSTLDPILGTTPSQLAAAPLSPHSHIVLTANHNRPEWWPVKVIGVTSQAAYNTIVSSSNEYATAAHLAATNGGATMPIPTNIFLWFQVLPGVAAPSGGVQTGGGGTAGFQHLDLLTVSGVLAFAGVGVLGTAYAYRRRALA